MEFSLALNLCHVGTHVVWGVGRDCGLLGFCPSDGMSQSNYVGDATWGWGLE